MSGTQPSAMVRTRSVTGSRSLDLACFAVLLGLMLYASPRLRVYFDTLPVRVTLSAVTPGGERVSMRTPRAFRGVLRNVRAVERRIREFSRSPQARRLTAARGTLQWRVHYGPGFARSRTVRIGSGDD